MPKPTITIVGRGIAALCIAREALLRGLPTVVVGKRARLGTATEAAVGVATLKGNVLASAPLFAAKMAGHRLLPRWLDELERDSGLAIPRLTGVIEPFSSMTRYATIRSRVLHRMFTGANRVEVLSRNALEQHAPFAAAAGGFLYPDDLWFDPRVTLDALETFARRKGARFVETYATTIRREGDGAALELGTEDGPLSCDRIVLANGIFANTVLARSGIADLEQVGVAGETIGGIAPSPAGVVLNAGKTNFVAFSGRFFYGSTSRNLSPGSSSAFSGPPDSVASALGRELEEKLGISWGVTASSSVFSGVRGRFPDQAPVLGPLFWTPFSDCLWVLLGFHKSGLQLAPLFARELVSRLDGNPPSEGMCAFAPDRFR